MTLTKRAMSLYKQGHIRSEVIEEAVKMASMAKTRRKLDSCVKLANKRMDIFGNYSKSMVKMAAAPVKIVPKGLELMERLIPATILTGGAAGIAALSDLGRRYALSRKHDESFKQMMEENPDIAHDPSMAKKHFDIMAKFAPDLAANPTIAGGHVRQVMEMGNVIPADTVKNLAAAQKTYNESNRAEGIMHQIVGGLASGYGSLVMNAHDLGNFGYENQVATP